MKPKKVRIGLSGLIENIQLTTLALPAIIILGIFSYWPMFGIVLAFKDFKVTKGILGSPWTKPLFKNFEFFFKSQDAWRVARNTIGLNFLFISVGTICGVFFALAMFEVKKSFQVNKCKRCHSNYDRNQLRLKEFRSGNEAFKLRLFRQGYIQQVNIWS